MFAFSFTKHARFSQMGGLVGQERVIECDEVFAVAGWCGVTCDRSIRGR